MQFVVCGISFINGLGVNYVYMTLSRTLLLGDCVFVE